MEKIFFLVYIFLSFLPYSSNFVWETFLDSSMENTCTVLYPDVENVTIFLDIITELLVCLSQAAAPASLVLTTNSKVRLLNYIGSGVITIAFFDADTLFTIQQSLEVLLHSIRYSNVVLVSVDGIQSEHQQMSLFKWCWQSNMLNIVMLDYHRNYSLGYNPFGTFTLYNLSNAWHRSQIFPNKLTNLHGHKFRTLSEIFTPTAFLYINSAGKRELGGFSGRIFSSYVEKHNGTLTHIQLRSKNVRKELNDLFAKGLADIAVHLHPEIEPEIYDRSMIVQFGQWCALVPAPKKLPPYLNLVKPFSKDVWVCIILGVMFGAVVFRIVSLITGEDQNWSFVCLLSLQTFLYQMGKWRINLMSNRFIVVYAPMLILGMVLNHLYQSHVASFLTSPIHGRQIRSARDIRNANIRILGVSIDVDKYVRQESLYKDFHDLVTGVSLYELSAWLNDFNNSNALMAPSDKIYHMLQQQDYFEDKIFSHPGICFRSLSYAYPVRHDFPFVLDLEFHLMLVSQAGFIAKWRREGFEESRQAGFVPKSRNFPEQRVVLRLDHLQMPFMVLASGLILSLVGFVAEIVSVRYVRRQNRKKTWLVFLP